MAFLYLFIQLNPIKLVNIQFFQSLYKKLHFAFFVESGYTFVVMKSLKFKIVDQ